MTVVPGLDVSRYQGVVNWRAVADAGFKLAVARATLWDAQLDETFETNWNGARTSGLLASAYNVIKPESTLNIRNGAGVNYQDIGDLPSGSAVTIGQVDGADVWVQLDANKWIALVYKGERNARTATVSGGLYVRVTADSLNVRSGPGVDQPLAGQLKKDASAPLKAVAGKDVWGEIEPGKWIAIAFRGDRLVDFV